MKRLYFNTTLKHSVSFSSEYLIWQWRAINFAKQYSVFGWGDRVHVKIMFVENCKVVKASWCFFGQPYYSIALSCSGIYLSYSFMHCFLSINKNSEFSLGFSPAMTTSGIFLDKCCYLSYQVQKFVTRAELSLSFLCCSPHMIFSLPQSCFYLNLLIIQYLGGPQRWVSCNKCYG